MAEEGHKVALNVYDLSQGMARQLSMTFLGKVIEGIWHTGIVVFGNEYYFGGGIQHCLVGKTPYGTPVRVVDLGVTHVPMDIFETYLQEISPRFTAETYSLMSHNCNNFSNEVAQFLVGTAIPDDILKLPTEILNSPMGPLIMPMIQRLEATLRLGAVPNAPQFSPQTINIASDSNNLSLPEVKKTEAENVEPKSQDALEDARTKIQDEINVEFAKIMASESVCASEAAALATKKVMQKYGHLNGQS